MDRWANAVLQELSNLVAHDHRQSGECDGKVTATAPQLPPLAFLETLLEQLDALGWDRIQAVSEDYREITVRLPLATRTFTLRFQLDPEHRFPVVPPIVTCLECPLPTASGQSNSGASSGDFVWKPHQSTLRDVLAHYTTWLEQWEQLLGVLSELDCCPWLVVLGNAQQQTQQYQQHHQQQQRRLSLGNHCTLQLTFSPQQPYALPQCQVFGPEKHARLHRDTIRQNSTLWDPSPSTAIPVKLERLLGTCIAQKKQQPHLHDQVPPSSESDLDCAICYCYQLESEYPDEHCPTCSHSFHYSCLVDWCKNLTTTRQSFHKLFLQCAYCDAPMTLNLASST